MFGLSQKEIEYIIKILQPYSLIEKAVIFGSRAKGNYKKTSDIDIALFGDQLDRIVLEISGKLNDQGPLPYKVDVLVYSAIDNTALREHIDRVGIPIFPLISGKK